MDFSNVDLSRFESKVEGARRLYELEYELEVTFGAQEGVLKFKATSQGKTIGLTSIKYNTVRYY